MTLHRSRWIYRLLINSSNQALGVGLKWTNCSKKNTRICREFNTWIIDTLSLYIFRLNNFRILDQFDSFTPRLLAKYLISLALIRFLLVWQKFIYRLLEYYLIGYSIIDVSIIEITGEELNHMTDLRNIHSSNTYLGPVSLGQSSRMDVSRMKRMFLHVMHEQTLATFRNH